MWGRQKSIGPPGRRGDIRRGSRDKKVQGKKRARSGRGKRKVKGMGPQKLWKGFEGMENDAAVEKRPAGITPL